MSMLFILLPVMLLAFTSWHASSSTVVGMSSMVWPCKERIREYSVTIEACTYRL